MGNLQEHAYVLKKILGKKSLEKKFSSAISRSDFKMLFTQTWHLIIHDCVWSCFSAHIYIDYYAYIFLNSTHEQIHNCMATDKTTAFWDKGLFFLIQRWFLLHFYAKV